MSIADTQPFTSSNEQENLISSLFNRKNHINKGNILKGDYCTLNEFRVNEKRDLEIPLFSNRLFYPKSYQLGEANLPKKTSSQKEVKSVNENNSNTNATNHTKSPKDREPFIQEQIINKNEELKIEETKIEPKIEEPKTEEHPPKIYKYYLKSTAKSLIQLEDGFGTDDGDLKHLIELMNDEPTKEKGYKEVVNEKNSRIYKKLFPGCDIILIKSICSIPYPKEIIYEAIANISIRKSWDSVFSELKVVANDGENGAEILYMTLKSPAFVSDRDFVQQRKIWKNFPNDKSHILHFKSVNHPKCPRNKKYVRAETIISGYYIQDKGNGKDSILGIISQTDVRGAIPIWLVNKVAPKASKGWVSSLLKGCQMVVDMQKKQKLK